MNNPRHVDPQKYKHIMRAFSANPRAFSEDTPEKLTTLKLSRKRLQFDSAFFSSPDRKWNS